MDEVINLLEENVAPGHEESFICHYGVEKCFDEDKPGAFDALVAAY